MFCCTSLSSKKRLSLFCFFSPYVPVCVYLLCDLNRLCMRECVLVSVYSYTYKFAATASIATEIALDSIGFFWFFVRAVSSKGQTDNVTVLGEVVSHIKYKLCNIIVTFYFIVSGFKLVSFSLWTFFVCCVLCVCM